ncbi:hypothetical protein FHW58_005158 [Duganella sp. 1224]|uniref:FlxA-like family protein n=1 Tax=Duganella sp. 1224 TaxID=2587052 RepID=UPI0015C7B951|nr:FlxA-like family protein [Duganella sp. 1224]NYE63924.1 hypothetical protein [Duganella sp. 1224]
MPSTIAIGASPTPATAYGGGGPSATSLQAQLQRYQQQLSDCVNCASAKTPQGKADIQAISARISEVKQSIAQAEQAAAKPTDASAPTSPPFQFSGVGNVINVFV